MFNSADKKKAVPARLRLVDGRKLKGQVIIGVNSDLVRSMNSDVAFIEFETPQGVSSVISKSAIVEVQPIKVPKAPRLDCEVNPDTFIPHKVLGLSGEPTKKELRTAYVKLAKRYHPDRFASMDLPKEMAAYVDATSRRINTAYEMLSPGPSKKVEKAMKAGFG